MRETRDNKIFSLGVDLLVRSVSDEAVCYAAGEENRWHEMNPGNPKILCHIHRPGEERVGDDAIGAGVEKQLLHGLPEKGDAIHEFSAHFEGSGGVEIFDPLWKTDLCAGEMEVVKDDVGAVLDVKIDGVFEQKGVPVGGDDVGDYSVVGCQ